MLGFLKVYHHFLALISIQVEPVLATVYLVLFYEPRKDLEALSDSSKTYKTGYRSCRYYLSSCISTQQMLPMKAIKVIEKTIKIDFSQQLCLSIFIDFRYNQLTFSIVIEYYRLTILSIAQAGCMLHTWGRGSSPFTFAPGPGSSLAFTCTKSECLGHA